MILELSDKSKVDELVSIVLVVIFVVLKSPPSSSTCDLKVVVVEAGFIRTSPSEAMVEPVNVLPAWVRVKVPTPLFDIEPAPLTTPLSVRSEAAVPSFATLNS